MSENDRVVLRHMLDAAYEAKAFAAQRTRSDLDDDLMLLWALVKAIEIIGEGAVQVSSAGRGRLPTLPWANMVGMRNRLVHAYFDINRDVVWRTVTEDIPDLIDQLESLGLMEE